MSQPIQGALRAVVAIALFIASTLPASAALDPGVPDDASGLLIPDGPITAADLPNNRIDRLLKSATGQVEVWVKLVDPSLAETAGQDAHRQPGGLAADQQRQHVDQLRQKQDAVASQIQGMGGQELGRVSKALNAVAVRVDASRLDAIAMLPGVAAVVGLEDVQVQDTAGGPAGSPASRPQSSIDGADVRVAIFDSGIDYTHADLGGPGTAEAYQEAYGTSIADQRNKSGNRLFPNKKVVGGYDFVGEVWPLGPNGRSSIDLAPDPNPIGCGPAVIPPPCDGGHGTNVADIVAGRRADGTAVGVAPGASLYAVKVCSAVSTSCSDLAILEGLEFALDPDHNGTLDDAVDVINMSLGVPYWQPQSSISAAVANVTRLGITVVAAAGNFGDKPYIVGSPAAQPEAIAVAQTTMPLDRLYRLEAGGVGAVGAMHQVWSADVTHVSGPLVYDARNSGTRIGCSNSSGGNPFGNGSHAGHVLLMDRGGCPVVFKVVNAAAAGASAAVIVNNVAGGPADLPPTFFATVTTPIAAYTVTLADGNALKSRGLGQAATFDPADSLSLAGYIIPESSRGPSWTNMIKPDIGAPGTTVSANAGTGTGEIAFGGTSGASPVVAGAAALLLQQNPRFSPREVKAHLMDTADTDIRMNPVSAPGLLAPISRIGAGQLNVTQALQTKTAAWTNGDRGGGLSFGFHTVSQPTTFSKTVRVKNYGKDRATYSIKPTFRYADDASSGALGITAPGEVSVPPGETRDFDVQLRVDPNNLPIWNLNGGGRGGDGFRLQQFEFDGYVDISGGTDHIHVPWHILPHRSANVTVDREDTRLNLNRGDATVDLSNRGAVSGRVDVFALTGTSPQIPKRQLPGPGSDFAVTDLKAVGTRLIQVSSSSGPFDAVQFGINTYGERALPLFPAEFAVFVDTNMDGTFDYGIFTQILILNDVLVTGQDAVWICKLNIALQCVTPPLGYFFTDADQNSANVIMTVPLFAMGITRNTQFKFSVFAFDNYFTGRMTDSIKNMTHTLAAPRFVPSTQFAQVPVGGTTSLTITAPPGGVLSSPSQTGLLLLYRDGVEKKESQNVVLTRSDD